MTTPSYLGAAHPVSSDGGGLLGRLGSYFGGGTPIYAGSGQPQPAASGGLLRGQAPIYLAAPPPKVEPKQETKQTDVPTSAAAPIDSPCEAAPIESPCEAALMECPIDPEAIAAGHIAIVIPRQRLIAMKQQ
ncbi:MAG TPA: hypothetical protein VFQ53_04600 [Kofleriaceae bacterium]|nr:hypothetical protein [Kofleriaceae bacterium]